MTHGEDVWKPKMKFSPGFARMLHDPAATFGQQALFTLPNGKVIDVATGYIPLLVNFTFEDRAAKGLRKRSAEDKPEPPIHFSALEVVRDNKILVLSGSSGSGKTTFATWLCWCLMQDGGRRQRTIVRNEFGHLEDEIWTSKGIIPRYCDTTSKDFSLYKIRDEILKLENHSHEELLIVLDNVVAVSPGRRAKINKFIEQSATCSGLRILVLSDGDDRNACQVGPGQPRFDLMPLFACQRRSTLAELLGVQPSDVEIGIGDAAASPDLLALALQSGNAGDDAETIVDYWLVRCFKDDNEGRQFCATAFDELGRRSHKRLSETGPIPPRISPWSRRIAELSAARHLSHLPVENALIRFRADPDRWEPSIRSLLRRMRGTDAARELITGLLSGSDHTAQRGALLVGDSANSMQQYDARVTALLLQILDEGVLLITKREQAGRILARRGDPRELQRLVEVPAGSFTMGSKLFPNSQPVHSTEVKAFKMSVFPVVNRDYARFVSETGRPWRSASANVPELLNAPATELTWHDANAYCSWLTQHWQTIGSIGASEVVRLPTEAEWERAARGDRIEDADHDITYPWGHAWQDDAANFEELPFNRVCTVGLFPMSFSPYGCLDMAGNIWEWCSTLWGKDMSTPSFRYPYMLGDGREAVIAAESARRILRGGCFSSTRSKLSCSYRGSLEPAGSWRGNGFRIVVAKYDSTE